MLSYLRYLLHPEKDFLNKLHILLGYYPKNTALYHLAFRHKSNSNTLFNGHKQSNERLEFLGDAVLSSIIAEILFKKYPFKDEGFLTELRSKIVNREFLNRLAFKLGINELINYNNDRYGKVGQSMYGDAFEALLGAIYLEQGYQVTRKIVIHRIVKPHVDIDGLSITETNFKSKLYEYGQRENINVTFRSSEKDTEGLFTIEAMVNDRVVGISKAHTKKEGEKLASEKACETLGLISND
jgi:ribonuclease III